MSYTKTTNPTIATLGSHSALEVCYGARAHGFSTLVVAQKGREKTYTEYFRRRDDQGCIDEVIILDTFKDILSTASIEQLQANDVIFVPNRSFEVYLDNDYAAIENDFAVPMFGNKYLLRMEERVGDLTQYQILEEAHIRIPQKFSSPEDIDRLCIVKAQQKERSFERAFFFASTPAEYHHQFEQRVASGLIDELEPVRIEEYILGAQVNLNFFYSPLTEKLELVGTDTRRQTNISGLVSLPAAHQALLPESLVISFEEAGHIAVTILESMLEPAFELGERFVAAAKTFHPQGIIGPFSLQSSIITTGSKKEFVVFDVSPRMPGSPGIAATPYSSYLHGRPVSMGERVAMELKAGVEQNRLAEITT